MLIARDGHCRIGGWLRVLLAVLESAAVREPQVRAALELLHDGRAH